MGSTGAVIKTPSGVEFTCSSVNRPLDYVLVDRRLESVVKVEPFLAVPWESHVALQISILRTPRTHTVRIVCVPRNFPLAKTETKVAWNENWSTQHGPQEEAQSEEPIQQIHVHS